MSEQIQPLISAILNRSDFGQMNPGDQVDAADLVSQFGVSQFGVSQFGVSRRPMRKALQHLSRSD